MAADAGSFGPVRTPGMRLAALRALAAAAAGILAARLWPGPAWVGIVAAGAGLAAGRLSKGWSLYFALAGALFSYASLRGVPDPTPSVYRQAGFEAVVVEEPWDSSRSRSVVRLEPPLSGSAVLQVKSPSFALRYGDLIGVRGTLCRFDFARNPGTFDLEAFYLARGVIGEAVVDGRDVRLLARGRGSKVMSGIVVPLRRHVRSVAERLVGGPEGALLLGLLVGERRGLPKQARAAFADSGTMHVLAVSGLHVGILAGVVWLLLSVARVRGWWRFGVSAAVMLLFVLVAGARAPAVRAGIMSLSVLVALPAQRKLEPLAGLGIAGLVLLLVDPMMLFDTGSQLSFAAAGGIVVATSRLQPVVGQVRPAVVRRLLVWPLLVSTAAFLATGPVLLYHFHRVQLLSPLASPLVVALVGPAIPLGLVVVALAPLSGAAAGMFAQTLQLVLSLVLKLASFFGSVRWAIAEPGPGSWMLFAWLSGLAFLLLGWRNVRIRTALRLGLVLGLNVLVWRGVFLRPRTAATFLDPMKGDAMVLEDTLGRVVLVDAGVNGVGVLRDYLRYRGIRRIDLAVITHPDIDHYGGLLDLDERCRIGRLVVPTESGEDRYLRLLHTLRARGTEISVAGRGTALRGLGFGLDFLWPERGTVMLFRRGLVGSNTVSLVGRYEHAGFRMLLTGDLDEPGLLAGRQVRAGLLKSPHHGSRRGNPDTLLSAVGPSWVVVMGRYPTPAGLESRLAQGPVRLANTRQTGAHEVVFRQGRPVLRPLVKSAGVP